MARQRHKWDPICDPPRGLFHPVRIDATGVTGPTRAQARGPEWRRVGGGWYVPSYVDPDLPEQRVVEAAVRLPRCAAITGWASGRMHGATFLDGLEPDGRTRIPVPVAVPMSSNPRRCDGVVYLRSPLAPSDLTARQRVACTIPERAAFDAMRTAPDVREAGVAMDMFAAAELTSVRRVRGYVDARPGWRGVGLAREALDLADQNSRSPNETRMRLIWVIDAGFPRPLVNQHVWDLSGKLLGIADLLDLEAGVVGEFDGADHRGARRQSKDEDRAGGFRDRGLELFRVTGADIEDRPKVVARMRAARARGRFEPAGLRRWTVVPPVGWEPIPTLDEILDERDAQRADEEAWERGRAQVEAELRRERSLLS